MKTFMMKAAALALTLAAAVGASAQMMMPPLPTDPDVRIGKLDNGLTYYIRHNEKPAKQADFYIAQKVGSVLEKPNQLGLAHFLEHMCFNGTKNFPDSMVTTWLESVGVQFGRNVNAYTWIDETVYNISDVPVERTGVQDSCLLILRDWAGDLLLTTKEINKQRGVIHEEWRMRGDANFRMTEATLPDIYGADSRYATVMPIGTMDIIDNFPEQALRDYYHTWYRPDLQGIIVVGDIDVDRIEAKIKEMFSDLSVPKKAPKREYVPVPDFKGTRYALAKDKEAQANIIRLNFLSDRDEENRGTQIFYMEEYAMEMITGMINSRLEEMALKPDCPFSLATTYYDGFYYSPRVKDGFSVVIIPKEHDAYPAYEAVYREILRAAKGFTTGEYDRTKAAWLAAQESAYKNRDSRTNDQYVNEYVRNFLDGNPIPGAEIDWQLAQAMSSMPVDVINELVQQVITDDNRVVIAFMADTPELVMPTPEGFENIHAKVGAEEIEGYVDQMRDDPLIANMPEKGAIVGESRDEQWDATVWELSNGARVVVRPTKFKEEQVMLDAFALSGTEMLPEKFDDAIVFDDMFNVNGLGTYTSQDLQKYLAGKNAAVQMNFSVGMREVEGSTTPKDLPTMMELVYMTFTDPYYDPVEFQSLINQIEPMLRSQMNKPEVKFQKLYSESFYASPRQQSPTPELLRRLTPDLYNEAARTLMANAADYTFVFTGNIDLDELRPLVEQYVATLPSNPATAVKAIGELNPAEFMKPGAFTVEETTEMETPQTYAAIVATADMPYNPVDALAANIAGEVLTKRLIDKVRQQMGAVYSLGANGSMRRIGPQNVRISTAFPMKPEMKQEVLDVIAGMFNGMESDITPDEYAGVVEVLTKDYKSGLERNEPWISNYVYTQTNGVDAYHTFLENLAQVTPEKVMEFMRRFNGQNGYKVVVLDPAAE